MTRMFFAKAYVEKNVEAGGICDVFMDTKTGTLSVGFEEPEEKEHEHDFNDRGLCECGEVWQPDDFSGATPGDR